ncbi:MAG: class II fructose-bisphosphate aldolase [Treponema sp.]|jgi:fructose/tagatose bisphosphate aldolase|nr:class II fructose-bisphosphate aldolase [Treponema sp.]
MNAEQAVRLAAKNKTIIPALNIPYLPMMEPVIRAVRDENSFAIIEVARLEWEKFESKSPEAVAEEYFKYRDPEHTLLHLDHVPVIDEDGLAVDYLPIIERAIKAGYQSVMIDASRLPLAENIRATAAVAELAYKAGIPVEAELGAIAGHEEGGIGMSYEELFLSKKGFTGIEDARRFAKESGCAWLSVSAGSIHGAIAKGIRGEQKPEARLDIDHIAALYAATGGMPLVLHGGSGIRQEYLLRAVQNGIAKINIGTEIRQPYEAALDEKHKKHEKPVTMENVREKVYRKTRWVLRDFLKASNTKPLIGKEQ